MNEIMKKTTTHLSLLVPAIAGLLLFSHSGAAQGLLTAGHADIGVGYEDEGSGFELHPHWHTHAGAVVDGTPEPADGEYDAGDLTAVVPASREFIAPINATFNTGTGVAAGDSYWTLPQGNVSGVPFLGLGAEELDSADWTGDITFAFDSATSPSGTGNFSLYQFDDGYNFFMSSADAGSNGGVTLTPGDHDHFTWAFSETGDWSIDLTISGEHATDGFQSATETFGFQVVPEPSSFAALAGIAALGFAAARRRRS